ncbi:MAG: flagellar protein FlgN [Calditrichaeota bacterium]|nr:flagellar protein FlgN [Calditrichota bacterium]
MKELIDQLISLIRQEEDVLEEFLDCLAKQRECIVQNRIDEFDLTVQRQDKLITQIRTLEDGRVQVVRTIAKTAGSQDDITIARLIEMNLEQSSEELRGLKTTLSRLIEKIKKANRVNQYLIKRSLSFLQRNIDLFIDEGQDIGLLYLPNGERRPQRISHILVDKTL